MIVCTAAVSVAAAIAPASAVSSGEGQGHPLLAVDDEARVTAGGQVRIPVLENDGGDGLSLTGIAADPAHGTAAHDEAVLQYQPDANFVGLDELRYRVSDGTAEFEATVHITVVSELNHPPVATDDVAVTRWRTPVAIDVVANDTDEDHDDLAVSAVSQPKRGTASLVRGLVRYSPVGKFVGPVSFEYTVDDGRGATATASVTVDVRPLYAVYLTRPQRAVALRTSQLRGRVTSRMDGRVSVKVQRRNDNGRWLKVRTTKVGSDNRFSVRWVPQQPGRERLRAVATWVDGKVRASPVLRTKVVAKLDPEVTKVTRKDVPKTWRPGCPVGPSSLRKIRMNYWDYHKKLRRGTLIGASWAVADYVTMFRRALRDKFQIKKMYPADRYGGVDLRAMRAGNTSAFNCRHVTGNPYRMSRHSWGDAIDINTFENPYVTGSRVYPAAAALRYHHRRSRHLKDPGVIGPRSAMARALYSVNWYWGARWSSPDYQHWSRNGG